ncbi:hypothetical protein MC885_003162, partial [Smutsia gigantea]
VKPARVPYKTFFTELATVQEEIVTLHNTLWRRVVPSTSNMLKMFSKFINLRDCLGHFLPHWLWHITMSQRNVNSLSLFVTIVMREMILTKSTYLIIRELHVKTAQMTVKINFVLTPASTTMNTVTVKYKNMVLDADTHQFSCSAKPVVCVTV